jgi:hypothetical protein
VPPGALGMNRGTLRTARPGTLVVLSLIALLLPACASRRDDFSIIDAVRRGDYAAARERIIDGAPTNQNDRGYMLDRAAYIPVALADGVPKSAERTSERLYEFLRTQGLNDDKTVGSFFLGEGNARIWKGEPFEQALMFHYIGLLDGLHGEWGNVRATATESLFLLRDFSRFGGSRAAQRDAVLRQPGSADAPDSLGVKFETTTSDFELGYAMKAIACRELGESNELTETLDKLVSIAPRLKDFAELIRAESYNTVLVVDFGVGPEKIATGTDGVYADWRPRTRSDGAPLLVRVGGAASEFPVITDVNRLADDLRWNNLEDMRLAKSALGTGLILGGATVAAASDDDGAKLAGLGAVIAGVLLKATASADTRHCITMPQRSYIALLDLRGGDSTIELEVRGRPESRLVIPAVPAGPERGLVLRYARLPERAGAWASAPSVRYGNDASGPLPDSAAAARGAALPWILGGRDVRTPSERVLADYRRAGVPGEMSLTDLIDLYKAEGISIEGITADPPVGRHILEGGDWLYAPAAGSAGFARLMTRDWPPYQPKSPRGRELAATLGNQSAGAP